MKLAVYEVLLFLLMLNTGVNHRTELVLFSSNRANSTLHCIAYMMVVVRSLASSQNWHKSDSDIFILIPW